MPTLPTVYTYFDNDGVPAYTGRIERLRGGAWIFVHPDNCPSGVLESLAADGDIIPGDEAAVGGTRYRACPTA